LAQFSTELLLVLVRTQELLELTRRKPWMQEEQLVAKLFLQEAQG